MVWVQCCSKDLEKKDVLLSNKAVCRTAPARVGLLNMGTTQRTTFCIGNSGLVDQHLVGHVSAGVTPGCVARNLAQNINIMDTAGLDMSHSLTAVS